MKHTTKINGTRPIDGMITGLRIEMKIGAIITVNKDLQIQYIGKRGTKAVLKIAGDRDKWRIAKAKDEVPEEE